MWQSKNTAIFVVLVAGVVIVSGCVEERIETSMTTILLTTTITESTLVGGYGWCNGCIFVTPNYPNKLKGYINFDILSEKAKSLNYSVQLSNYSQLEGNQTIRRYNIKISKKIENYTAQIQLLEIVYSDDTRVQSVDRAYFGESCDFEFARSRMVRVLDELGIELLGNPPKYTGLPEKAYQAAECAAAIMP